MKEMVQRSVVRKRRSCSTLALHVDHKSGLDTAMRRSKVRVHPSGLLRRWPARSAAKTLSASETKSHAVELGARRALRTASGTPLPIAPFLGSFVAPKRTTDRSASSCVKSKDSGAQTIFIGYKPRTLRTFP